MENLPDRPASENDASAPDGGASVPAERTEGGPVARIAAHTQGLVDDLRQWIDLRIDIAILEVEEKIDEVKNQAALGVALLGVAVFTVTFLLLTLAIGTGFLLGTLAFEWGTVASLFLGFGIVTVILAIVAAVLASMVKRKAKVLGPTDLYHQFGRTREEPTPPPARQADATVTG
jgi:hypothetical protein